MEINIKIITKNKTMITDKNKNENGNGDKIAIGMKTNIKIGN